MCICYVWLVDKWIRMLPHQFAIQSLCGLKQSWKSASPSSEWSPNSLAGLAGFRRYLVSHCPLVLTLPPSLASSTLTHTWHSITRGQLAVLPGTLCLSMSLLSPHALHYACHTLAGIFFFFGPWKWWGPYELLPWSPTLVYLLFFPLALSSCWIFTTHWNGFHVSFSLGFVWSSKRRITSCLPLSPTLSVGTRVSF